MAHSKFKNSKSELYKTALISLIGSFTGSETDIETIVLLSEKYDWERCLEQEEAKKTEAQKSEVIDVKYSEEEEE